MHAAPVFRFAPSPNGYLHLGHACRRCSIRYGARAGGRLLLRIEDIDATRCRPEYEAGDLRGSAPGSASPGRSRCWRQSEHFDDYRAALDALAAQGLHLSQLREPRRDRRAGRRARATRAWPRDPDGAPLYPGQRRHRRPSAQRRIAGGEPYALRLDMAAAIARAGALAWTETAPGRSGETGDVAAAPAAWGDVVLARKEAPTSYHLSVVVDDARRA